MPSSQQAWMETDAKDFFVQTQSSKKNKRYGNLCLQLCYNFHIFYVQLFQLQLNGIGKSEATGSQSHYIYLFIYLYSALPVTTEVELKVL